VKILTPQSSLIVRHSKEALQGLHHGSLSCAIDADKSSETRAQINACLNWSVATKIR
jgi:hypothetical protein